MPFVATQTGVSQRLLRNNMIVANCARQVGDGSFEIDDRKTTAAGGTEIRPKESMRVAKLGVVTVECGFREKKCPHDEKARSYNNNKGECVECPINATAQKAKKEGGSAYTNATSTRVSENKYNAMLSECTNGRQ